MQNLKTGYGEQTIKTAYGDKIANSVSYVERAELIALVNEALSIRGKDAVAFSNRLRTLLLDYEPIVLPPAKYIEEAPILIGKNRYKNGIAIS